MNHHLSNCSSINHTLRALGVLMASFLLQPLYAEEVTHKKVQQALDWELPENPCKKPKMIAVSAKVNDGEGSRSQTDVDTYTIKRYERKKKRWDKCVTKYKKGLMSDFEDLKASAQHGLTKPQADIILGKMAMIQKVYMNADGVLEEAPTPPNLSATDG